MEQSSSFVQHQSFQFSLLRSEFRLAQLPQNDGEEDSRIKGRRQDCGEIEAHGDEPGFNCLDEFFISEPSDCIQRPGKLVASGRPESKVGRNSKPDAASSSQGRLNDAYLGGLMVEVAGKASATDKSQELWESSESETWSNDESGAAGKLDVFMSRNSGESENHKTGSRKCPHHFRMSPAVVPHMEKVHSIVRKIYGRSPTDDLNDLDVNTALWGKLMNVTLQAAVPFGRDYVENLRFTMNQLLKSLKQMFQHD